MEETNEVWKDIEGYEGLYKVSNIGNVKSLKYGKERILKPGKNRYGYLIVKLCKEGKTKTMKVHRLVCSAFVQNDSLFNTEVNHKDECKTNNNVNNLEWCTKEYNCNFGTRNERVTKLNTNNIKKSKAVIQIKTGIIFPSTQEVQRKLGFHHSGISACCRGEYKQAYGYHWKYVDKKRD